MTLATFNKATLWVTILGLIVIMAFGTVGVYLAWSSKSVAAARAEEAARIQFQLTRANMCAITSTLVLMPEARTPEGVQAIIDDCIAQVDLPFTARVNVPDQ